MRNNCTGMKRPCRNQLARYPRINVIAARTFALADKRQYFLRMNVPCLVYDPENQTIAPTNCMAKLKALDPIMSTSAPSLAKVIQYDEYGAKVSLGRYLPVGTLVQLHVAGEFSLWTVKGCSADGDGFNLDLKLSQLVSPR
jgi:hypothetical protein